MPAPASPRFKKQFARLPRLRRFPCFDYAASGGSAKHDTVRGPLGMPESIGDPYHDLAEVVVMDQRMAIVMISGLVARSGARLKSPNCCSI